VASGEFETTDVSVAALCTCQAMVGYFHPQMIAQAMDKPGKPHAEIEQMVDFLLAGLASRNNRA
jgi:hypothetical protein